MHLYSPLNIKSRYNAVYFILCRAFMCHPLKQKYDNDDDDDDDYYYYYTWRN